MIRLVSRVNPQDSAESSRRLERVNKPSFMWICFSISCGEPLWLGAVDAAVAEGAHLCGRGLRRHSDRGTGAHPVSLLLFHHALSLEGANTKNFKIWPTTLISILHCCSALSPRTHFQLQFHNLHKQCLKGGRVPLPWQSAGIKIRYGFKINSNI